MDKARRLTVRLITVETHGNPEEHLLVAAATTEGVLLAEDGPEELQRLPAITRTTSLFNAPDATLLVDVKARKNALLRDVNERNLGYFEQEVQKLDAWADDLKLGLDRGQGDRPRDQGSAPNRRELFSRQDDVDAQRNDSISQLEIQLQQQVEECTLFTVEWELK